MNQTPIAITVYIAMIGVSVYHGLSDARLDFDPEESRTVSMHYMTHFKVAINMFIYLIFFKRMYKIRLK